MRTWFFTAALLVLSACGGSDTREAGGISPAEAEALDRAAAMLEAERVPGEAIASPPVPPAPVKPVG